MKDWLEWPLRRHFDAAARIGLLAVVVMFVVWGLWSLSVGHSPEVTNIEIAEGSVFTLPVVYNRWWDVPTAYLFVFLYWWVALGIGKLSQMSYKEKNVVAGSVELFLLVALLLGIIVGLTFGTCYGLLIGLIAGLATILILSLIVVLGIGIWMGLVTVLKLLKFLTNKESWRKFRAWLIAAEVR